MFEPLNIFKSIKENYKIMFEDYKWGIWTTNFIVIPIIFALYFTLTLDQTTFVKIIGSSIEFFSIIVGFLINVLILIASAEKVPLSKLKELSKDERETEERKEKLKENLSYNILTTIFFGIILVLMIVSVQRL